MVGFLMVHRLSSDFHYPGFQNVFHPLFCTTAEEGIWKRTTITPTKSPHGMTIPQKEKGSSTGRHSGKAIAATVGSNAAASATSSADFTDGIEIADLSQKSRQFALTGTSSWPAPAWC